MRDLLGRLTALDPEASETLKVISDFDELVERSAGAESMVRGAAVLSGTTAGYRDGARVIRVGTDGVRLKPADRKPSWPARSSGPDQVAWIERDGQNHANDAMVLERLCLALSITRVRRTIGIGTEGAVELAVSGYASTEERAGALSRLSWTEPVNRVLATPPETPPLVPGPSSVIATRYGLVRATLVGASAVFVPEATADLRLGIGVETTADTLPEAWSSAVIALRLTTATSPVIDAADLGAALTVAETAKDRPLHPDSDALSRLDPQNLELLDSVVNLGSVRAAAARLNRHHSTVQERLIGLVRLLGYDPRTPLGHTRYVLARMLLTLEPDS
jgi:hypothetical protein